MNNWCIIMLSQESVIKVYAEHTHPSQKIPFWTTENQMIKKSNNSFMYKVIRLKLILQLSLQNINDVLSRININSKKILQVLELFQFVILKRLIHLHQAIESWRESCTIQVDLECTWRLRSLKRKKFSRIQRSFNTVLPLGT